MASLPQLHIFAPKSLFRNLSIFYQIQKKFFVIKIFRIKFFILRGRKKRLILALFVHFFSDFLYKISYSTSEEKKRGKEPLVHFVSFDFASFRKIRTRSVIFHFFCAGCKSYIVLLETNNPVIFYFFAKIYLFI